MGWGRRAAIEQAGGEGNAADGACGLVLLPAGAGEIAAGDTLDGKHGGALDEHGAAGKLIGIGLERSGKLSDVRGDDVVGDEVA